jgi:hypothetical protein
MPLHHLIRTASCAATRCQKSSRTRERCDKVFAICCGGQSYTP